MPTESKYAKLLEDKDVKSWHDNLTQGSPITADVYLRRLGSFCTKNSLTPASLVKVKPKQIQNLLITLVSDMKKEGNAGAYIHSNVKAVKSWLAFNEVEIKNKIKIEGSQDTPTLKDERVPTKEELKRIFNAADLQQRVACGLLGHVGLRPETLGNYDGTDGLKISDLLEIEIHPRKKEVTFKKIPSMVRVRSNLSKAGHEYFGFASVELCQYVKEYLEHRMRDAGEELKEDSPILTPKKDSHTKKALGSHITSTNVGDMMRTAIRKAGFNWRPYVLRAYFDSQTLIAENNGKIAKDYRAFFMGHKGDIEARYTTNKGKLTEEMIEDMRQAYKKASFYLQTTQIESKDENELKRLFLLAAHVPEKEIKEKGMTQMSYDELGKYLQDRLKTSENARTQMAVPVCEVKTYLSQGYEFMGNLGNGEAVLKLPL